ncbi:MAG: sulfatase-like hydrolase/transferase [Planctomycetaceae bacterium]|nr:sulfatase-like hydrolase/transferase [Planctomycetaceae bacterium]
MPRKKFSLRCVVAWLAVAAYVQSGDSAAAATRPNIILILLDNVGQEWFGCYGGEASCTPRIDQLAATGVRVENCYTPPVCGPSRTVLLTGRYPHTTGFRLHHDAALYSGGGLQPERDIIFPRLLRDAGYATAMTGKWQINNLYDEPEILERHGFQEHLAWPGSIDRDRVDAAGFATFRDIVRREAYEEAVAFNRHIESRYWDPVFLRNGVREVRRGEFGPDVSRDFAMEFLRRPHDRPFFLYLPMVLTHGRSFTENVVPTPRNRDAGRPAPEMFADMLRYADDIVGQIVDELDRLKLRDETILIVASDNGTEHALSTRRHGRTVAGGLYTLTEAGGNVVLLFNAPPRFAGGRTIPLADFTDLYPTICEFAGATLDSNYPPDGRSLAPYLLGRAAAPPRRWILNEYHDVRVVRDERYKLYNDGRMFDVVRDPVEERVLPADADEKEATAARARLSEVLRSLPPDAPPPFRLLSLSAFKIRAAR